jgi:hypothetical protein
MPSELNLSEIKDLLNSGKSRLYKPCIIEFVKSDEIYEDMMQNPAFTEKNASSVFQSFKNNLDKLVRDNPDWPHIEVKKAEKDGKELVLLINMTLLAGAVADED